MGRKFVGGLFGLLVTVAFAAAPAAAQAEAPEFGRCLPVTGTAGLYKDKACTATATPGKAGGFEWFPGAAKASFTTKSKEGTKILFEGVNKVRVTCTGETSSGEYTTPKLEEHVVFKFTGCMKGELPVSSAGAASGEVLTNPTECELGVLLKGLNRRGDKVGLTCAEEGAFMWMKWGGLGGLYQSEWCLRGWWFFSLAANKMKAVTPLLSRESKGVQYWEKFVEGPPEPLEASFNEGATWERAALSLHSVQTSEEPIEVNTVV
jgi:hypothetical protein